MSGKDCKGFITTQISLHIDDNSRHFIFKRQKVWPSNKKYTANKHWKHLNWEAQTYMKQHIAMHVSTELATHPQPDTRIWPIADTQHGSLLPEFVPSSPAGSPSDKRNCKIHIVEKYKLCHRAADQWPIFPFITFNLFILYLNKSKSFTEELENDKTLVYRIKILQIPIYSQIRRCAWSALFKHL